MIYTSLIRSIIDYSAITYPFISSENELALERIQKAAVKIILRLPPRYSSEKLRLRHSLPSIKERMMQLADSYLESAIINGNPLVLNALDQFDSFLNVERVRSKSILTDLSEKVQILLSLDIEH